MRKKEEVLSCRKAKKKRKKSGTVAVGHLQIFVVGRDGPCNPKVEDRRGGYATAAFNTAIALDIIASLWPLEDVKLHLFHFQDNRSSNCCSSKVTAIQLLLQK